ncbi:MCE family protein [Antrihabitans sp. YC2-6]|nr:MCE family protein [Antrihabitans sp. YC2-6]
MRVVLLATAVAVSTAGCGVSLSSLPLPAPGVGADSYEVTATFANALNLPTKAKVKLAGADVGQVTSMSVDNYQAIVHMQIREGVLLPVGTTAQLRSATPLGDVFVAVTPPVEAVPGAAVLTDGASIPLAETTAGSTVEEILTAASLLVNGGAIRNMTKVLNGLGSALGDRGGNLAGLIHESTRLISTLAARSGEIRSAVDQTAELTATLNEQRDSLNDAVAAAGPAVSVINENSQQLVDLLTTVQRITDQLGKFPSIQGIDERGMIHDLNLLAATFNDIAQSPNTSVDAINALFVPLIATLPASGLRGDVDIMQLAAGALPDFNSPGDPGFRLPELNDVPAGVGSLVYTLLRLKDRVIGPGR